MHSTIRIATNDPQAEDFTAAELKDMKATRERQNSRLLGLLTGEYDALPKFCWTFVPGATSNPPPIEADLVVEAAAKLLHDGSNGVALAESTRRGNLRTNKQIVFPENKPIPGQVAYLKECYVAAVDKWTTAAQAMADLYQDADFFRAAAWARGYRALYGADVFTRESN